MEWTRFAYFPGLGAGHLDTICWSAFNHDERFQLQAGGALLSKALNLRRIHWRGGELGSFGELGFVFVLSFLDGNFWLSENAQECSQQK